jgi:hypothetical protein
MPAPHQALATGCGARGQAVDAPLGLVGGSKLGAARSGALASAREMTLVGRAGASGSERAASGARQAEHSMAHSSQGRIRP